MAVLLVEKVEKKFTPHLQGGASITVFDDANLAVEKGECVALTGASGIGKSTLLKLIYGSYRALGGRVLIEHRGQGIDMVDATPRQILSVRRQTLGYVSQFLRCLPRVPAKEVVAEPLIALGVARETARLEVADLLGRLHIPKRLHDLSPVTFSGGEQQRVNIARGFVHHYPILLLDEPTASLDAENRDTVVEMIHEAKHRGTGIVGIFHDADVRAAVTDREIDVEQLRAAA